MSFPRGCKWRSRTEIWVCPYHSPLAVAALLKRDKGARQSWLRACDYKPFLRGYSSQSKALLSFCLDFHPALHESSEERRKWKGMEGGNNKEGEIKHGEKMGKEKVKRQEVS